MRQLKHILICIFAFILTISSGGIHAFAKTAPIVTHVATVNASSLRLRSGPSTSHSTIGYAPEGDYVTILGKTGVWYHVEHNLQRIYA